MPLGISSSWQHQLMLDGLVNSVAPTSSSPSSSSNGAPRSDLDFLNSLSTTTAATGLTSSSTAVTTREDTATSDTPPPSHPNDITQSLAFIDLSRQLDVSIPDSLASTQAAYDALLELKTPTKQNGPGDGERDDDNDAADEDEDGLDERAILDLLNKMESADMAAQEFEGRLDKLLQGLDGMLESLGAAGEMGEMGADEGTSSAVEEDSPETALSDKKEGPDSAGKQ